MRSKFVPDWLTYEVEQALSAIAGDNVATKEKTVLRMAEAVATGKNQKWVWSQHGTCSKNTWHGVGDKAGWKDDPVIAHALELATERARWWMRVREGGAVQDTLDELMDVAPIAARQIASIIRYGQVTFVRPDGIVIKQASVAEVAKEAESVLDRVSAATATKATMDMGGAIPVRVVDYRNGLAQVASGSDEDSEASGEN